jgi:DNA-binding sugar fermentation-stimulating protein
MFQTNFKSKYRSTKKEYNGRIYHSKREADNAFWLDNLLKNKQIKEIKPQYKLHLVVNGHKITTHIVDFLITLNDGRQKLVEVKGFATDTWRIKQKLTEALYPELPYLVNPTEKELLS